MTPGPAPTVSRNVQRADRLIREAIRLLEHSHPFATSALRRVLALLRAYPLSETVHD